MIHGLPAGARLERHDNGKLQQVQGILRKTTVKRRR